MPLTLPSIWTYRIPLPNSIAARASRVNLQEAKTRLDEKMSTASAFVMLGKIAALTF